MLIKLICQQIIPKNGCLKIKNNSNRFLEWKNLIINSEKAKNVD